MSMPAFSPNTVLLYTTHLEPNTFTLCGAIPNQYPTGISIYIANNAPYNTMMSQVVITQHQVPNAANVFNKTMYIPSQNMAKLENISNIAGMNIFVQSSGTHSTVYVVYNPTSSDGNQLVSVTPNVVNNNQTITPMPGPASSTANSIGSQLIALNGQVANLNNLVTLQGNVISEMQQQILFLQTTVKGLT